MEESEKKDKPEESGNPENSGSTEQEKPVSEHKDPKEHKKSQSHQEHKKEEPTEKLSPQEKFAKIYEKNHKLFAIIPLIILFLSLAFLGFKWIDGQELIKKDVSLTGGISITVQGQDISVTELEQKLSEKFDGVIVRKLSVVGTGEQLGVTIETTGEEIDLFRQEVESILQIKLTEENSSIEFTGPLLSKSFFRQLMWAFAIAFIFIAIVVLIIFRVFVPSFIAVFSIFSDAVITLTILSLIDFRLSSAGIAAFLMLIGYSIDTDILLTTRVLKRREKEFYIRLWEAAQTGLTMTFAGIIAVLVSYFFLISPILKEIFLILTIGLFVDLMNTWLFNASVLRMYVKKQEKSKGDTS